MAITLGSNSARIGHALGTGLAQPIHQHLDLMAQQKLQEIQQNQLARQQHAERQRYAQGLAPLLGTPTAQFLSNLGPDERKSALQNLQVLMQFSENPRQQQQPQQMEQQGGLNALVGQQQQGQELQPGALNALTGQKNGSITPEQQQEQQQQMDRAKLAQDVFTSPHERREREKVELQKQKIANQEKAAKFQEKSAAFKETKPERTEIIKGEKGAKENIARLERMEELSRKGKLNSPLYLEFLRKSGFDIPALTSPDSQEFRKLETDFLRDARNIFGGRVTNYEMNTFLKAIPSLSQSPEGRERVIHNLKLFNQAALETLREILKENGGIPPFDLMEQISDKSAPKIDKIYQEFSRGISQERKELNQSSQKSFQELPNASDLKDKRIVDEDTGKVFKSNGSEWVEVS